MYRRLATVGIVTVVVFPPSLAAGATGPERDRHPSEVVRELMQSGHSPAEKGMSNPPESLSAERTADGQPRRDLTPLQMRAKYQSRVFLPGLPEVGIFDPSAGLAEVDETQMIQLVYDTYSRYSEKPDGERVEFTFHGFRTLYRDDFDDVAYYPDLVTLGSDWKLKAHLVRTHTDGVSGVEYRAEWMPTDNLLERPDFAAMLGKSAREMVELVAGHFPEWQRTIAITSYGVTVDFLGRSQTYRGAFAWLLDETGEVSFVVVDGIVPEVQYASLETLPPLATRRDDQPSPFERTTASSGTAPTCSQQTWPTVYSPQHAGHSSMEHTSGRHEAVYIGKFDCSCSSSCLSVCNPGFVAEACQDYGSITGLGRIHEATGDSDVASGSESDGHTNPAECASGMGCFVKSCYGNSCGGVDVRISGGIGGLSFTTTSPTIMSESFTHSHGCGACTELEPPPDESPSQNDKGDTSGEPVGDQPTPILVDLDRGGFRLTDLAGGVEFDVDADGAAERVSWTAAGSGDAWLALDRDGDGLVGDGSELFGDHTPQPPATQPHGYLALAVFDQPAEGGDGDGWITAADAVFPALRLWTDRDHDGVSQPAELSTLAEGGVTAIDLRYVESRRTDRHGNRFRYSSRVRLDRGTTRSADVFLLSEDIE